MQKNTQSTPRSFKKFKKIPLMLSLAFLALSSCAFLFLYKEIKENEKEGEVIHAEWQAEATRRDEIRSLERSIKEIAPERTLIETHFAESSNVVPFLDTIEKMAADAGAESEVNSVDISKERSELIVTLTTRGSFESTYKFIRLLENSPYELEIAAFDIKTAPDATSRRWEGFFTIRLLSFVK